MVDEVHQLDGLSAEEIAAAAHAAAEKGLTDRWLIPLLNTTQQPALAALSLRETRKSCSARAGNAPRKATKTIRAS